MRIGPLSFAAFVLACMMSAGCATKKAAPPPPSEAVRAQFGTVGVITAPSPPLRYYLPRGKGAGAGQGALGNLKVAGAVAASGAYAGDGAIISVPLGAATAVLGTPVGAVVGLVRGVPKAERLEAERVITNAFSAIQTEDCLRAKAIRQATGLKAHSIVELPMGVPAEARTNSPRIETRSVSASSQDPDSALTNVAPGIKTVLELRVLSWELGGQESPYINPKFQLLASAQASLLDRANGAVLYRYANSYRGARRMKFADWAAEEAKPLREEFQKICDQIARDMIEQIFIRMAPATREDRAGPARVYGPHPVYPKARLFSAELAYVKVDSLLPTLSWEPWGGTGVPGSAAHVTYDLKIWRVEGECPGELVYYREGLPHAIHQIEEALEPRTSYFWSVRARFDADGQTRVSDWSLSAVPWDPWDAMKHGTLHPQHLGYIPCRNYFRFRTP